MTTFVYPAAVLWTILPACAVLAWLLARWGKRIRWGLRLDQARPSARLPELLLALSILLYTSTFVVKLTLRFLGFGNAAYDVALFDQATWLLSQGLTP